jgi:peptidoglycan/xylan/chitin deacetylase (PgdA/CDA1 family)
MLIELSREKIKTLFGLAMIITGGLIIFILSNGIWNFVPHTANFLARAESQLMYNLLYKWPNGSALYADAGVPVASASAHSIPVLLYHGEGGTSGMPTVVFVDQMRSLKEDGWRTITLAQFDDFMKNGTPLPDKSFLLTFDDGRKDTFYQSDPILKDLGFNAIMYVITGFSLPADGKQPAFYLSQSELQYMVQSGRWDLESHGDQDHRVFHVQSTTDLSQEASTTDGHFMSNKFWVNDANRFETDNEFAARVQDDLKKSKNILEKTFGIHVISYAYPFNDFGQDSVNFPGSQKIDDAIVPNIYGYAFYQTWPGNGDTFNYAKTNNGPGSLPYMIKRIEPAGTWSGKDLLDKLQAGRGKSLPYQSTTFGSEWTDAWGSISTGTPMLLKALPTTSGAAAYLNGSNWWHDYIFSATVDHISGNDVALMARNTDDKNYLACTFSASGVMIEDHGEGTQVVLARSGASWGASEKQMHLGIGVRANQITCYVNNQPVVSTISESDPIGGIGLEVWDRSNGNAQSAITSVTVKKL